MRRLVFVLSFLVGWCFPFSLGFLGLRDRKLGNTAGQQCLTTSQRFQTEPKISPVYLVLKCSRVALPNQCLLDNVRYPLDDHIFVEEMNLLLGWVDVDVNRTWVNLQTVRGQLGCRCI